MIVGTGTSWRHGHRSSVQRSVAAGVGGAGTSSSTTPRTEPPLDPSGYSGVTITGGVGSELGGPDHFTRASWRALLDSNQWPSASETVGRSGSLPHARVLNSIRCKSPAQLGGNRVASN